MKFSWSSAAMGALAGAGVTFGVHHAPADPGSEAESMTVELPKGAPRGTKRPTPSPASTKRVEPSSAENMSGARTLASELAARLEAAYRQEALPEIIGAEAGAEAADQVFDYIVAADDPDVVSDLLGDFLERSPDDLEIPGFEMRGGMDCDTAPCVARIELVPPGDPSECRAAMFTLKTALKESLQPGSGQFDVKGCRMTIVALSPDARGRELEIDRGVEGFLKRYFAPAKDRAAALELE